MERQTVICDIREKFQLLLPSFTERTKRLWCAVEARQLGWGGVSIVQQATGISMPTIRKGIKELEQSVELTPVQSRRQGGGLSQVLADRMKAAEQLVYGEQIGWIDPRIVDDPVRFPFFRDIVLTRYKYREYFYKGEMIRPPKLRDENPKVTADWQWYGETIIMTDAVQTGAWRKTDEKGNTISAVFFFVNVSDKPITSCVAVRLDEIGLETDVFDNPLTFEPGVPMAIEVMPESEPAA